jgi:hypothetical protein
MPRERIVSDVIDNAADNRFEVTQDGHTAELTYAVEGDRITLIHTEVPGPLEGCGIGGELVEAAVERARRERLTIVPWCPYARRWLRKHTAELADVVIDWKAARPE